MRPSPGPHRGAALWTGLLALAIGACDSESAPKSGPDPIEGLEQAREHELSRLRDRYARAVADHRERRCPRPVLRGEPLPGSAAVDMRAVLEGDEDTAPCLRLLDDLANKQPDWAGAILYDGLPTTQPALVRSGAYARAPGDPAAGTETVERVVATCAPLVERLRRAVAHGDACSPYRPGLECADDLLLRLRVARVVALSAHRRLAAGERRAAAELLLDGLRFGQDLTRGGACMLDAAVGVAMTETLVPVLELLLVMGDGDDTELWLQLQRELERLAASEPPPAALLRGEYETVMIEVFKQRLIDGPAGLRGGVCIDDRRALADVGLPAKPAPPEADAEPLADPLLVWMAYDRAYRFARDACDPEQPPRACVAGLKRTLARARALRRRDPAAYLKKRIGYLLPPGRAAAWAGQADSLAVQLEPERAWREQLLRYGRRHFYYAALRAAASWMHAAAGMQRCPRLSDLQLPAVQVQLENAYSGKQVAAMRLAPGQFAITPRSKPGRSSDQGQRPAVVLRCRRPAGD